MLLDLRVSSNAGIRTADRILNPIEVHVQALDGAVSGGLSTRLPEDDE
jgi:hypothetical protein